MGGMFMTMIGAGCTVLVIYITIQTCNTAKKVKRIWEYLDIKDTRREQEEDDQLWRENIEQEIKVLRPNPTRNQAQMDYDKKKMNQRLNRTAQGVDMTDENVELLRQHAVNWCNTRMPTRDQEEEVTIPLL